MSDFSPWYPQFINPVRVGVYQTSRDMLVQDVNIKDIAHGYGYWTGKEWLRWKSWGNHMLMNPLRDGVWRGLSSEEAAKRNPAPGT